MGHQYARQRFSSASCAAGDSPCASSTTLQCVVVNIAAPPDAEAVALSEVTSSAAALTPLITVRSRAESKPVCNKQIWIGGGARRCVFSANGSYSSQPG